MRPVPIIRWAAVLAAGTCAFAADTAVSAPIQGDMPTGFVRGTMAAWEGTPASGQITVRSGSGSLSSCGYDFQSWFERAHERIAVSKLLAGEPLEVLADRKPGSRLCYVRIAHVLDPPVRVNPRRAAAVRPSAPLVLRGDRTISGIVLRHESEGHAVTVRTRTEERIILLRPDTAYIGNGLQLDSSALPVNTHVFVRAGRNSDGRIEAYQVMWGSIVENPGN